MTEIERLESALRKVYPQAKAGDPKAQKQSKALAAEIRRLQSAPSGPDFMGQLNAGIGDVVDLLNPFDTPAVSQALGAGDRLSTGPAVDMMNAVGVNASTDAPDGFVEAFARGAGQSAASAPIASPLLQAGSRLPGAVGMAADDAARAMNTVGGFTAETVAGGVSKGAGQAAGDAGAPKWVQDTAEIAAPLALAAAPTVLRHTPTGYLGRKALAAVAPMTESGAREVARGRVQDLAGGADRASRIASGIEPQSEFGLTPAQQTQEPNLVGLEQAAEREDAGVAETLAARRTASQDSLEGAAQDMGGDIETARAFFERRQREVRANLQTRVDRALSDADANIASAGPRSTNSDNSTRMTGRLKAALDDASQEEKALWAAVPREVTVAPSQARLAAQQWEQELGRAGAADLPDIARRLLLDDNGYSDAESAGELHRLYSKLREIGRNDRAGTQKRETRAKVAGDIAEALLDDLGAVEAPSTELGRSLNEARAYTRAMAETFDQGAVGRILRRTSAGDEQITPEAALDRTVGRGGAAGKADDASIRGASQEAESDVADYLRGRFADQVFNASGEFTPKSAKTWLRNNRELLNRHPAVRAELYKVTNQRDAAQAFAIRSQERLKLAEQGPIGDFSSGKAERAVTAILGADSPVKAARRIASEARRDTSGKALGGVKGAFSSYLTEDAAKLPALLADKNTRAAMSQVFDKREMQRWDLIARSMRGLSASGQDVGQVIDSPSNRIISYIVRIAAAKQGGQLGGGTLGGSMQTANIAVDNATQMLRGLTNRKARRILMDAVQDPALMKELLTEPRSLNLKPVKRSKLAPYLVGAAVTQGDGE